VNQSLVIVQVADWMRTYTVIVTALALAFTVVNLMTMRPYLARIVLFIAGVDVTLVSLLFGQLANLGRTITWRTVALAVGVTVIAVSSWMDARARRRLLNETVKATEGIEDGDQSS
jgi:hypothetical protein